MATEAQRKAVTKYNKKNLKQIRLALNVNTDQDIIRKLETAPSKMGYIKELIRKDIQGGA